MELEAITKILGGAKVLGRRPHSELELVDLVREGLPYEALAFAIEQLEISREEATKWLGLTARTIARRAERKQRLDRGESEKLVRLARINGRAEAVLGSQQKASRWLQKSNRALGGKAPVSLLDTDIGAQAVEDLLGRIEYGVYS